MQEQLMRSVLVANRGEIALRIMRTCKELGIRTIAIYGDGEEHAPHVRYADDAWRIPDGSGLDYLRIPAILDVARQSGAEAVHPGYGFLAENASFATAVADAGLVFVGPPASAIAAMGNKVEARRIAEAAGVHAVPGTQDAVESVDVAREWAAEHGYPIAVKASGGGGGRGFRVARSAEDLGAAFDGSRGEAERYFANPEVYLERYIEEPRHIEIQVFVDPTGAVATFPERECSVQRRHQKLIEEAPSTAVSPALRERFHEAARRLVEGVGYLGVGTIEFLLDTDESFYFLEMNTRVQVEHTVTEMITGIDIVHEQLRCAMGLPLSFDPAALKPNGWSIECRINAEDASRQFAPASGPLTTYREPAGFGVRVDAALGEGDAVSPTYDSLISKLVTWGRDRDEAIARMERALDDYDITGVPTTIPFDKNVMANDDFRAGKTYTTFLTLHPEVLEIPPIAPDGAQADETEPTPRRDMLVEVNGRRFDVRVFGDDGPSAQTTTAKRRPHASRRATNAGASGGAELFSPIQGTVLRVEAEPGQAISQGDLICVIEAMKMENEIKAHRDGVLTEVHVAPGGTINAGGVLATIGDAPA